MNASIFTDVSSYAAGVERGGYAMVEGVISPAQVQALREAIADLPEGKELRRRQNVYGVRNLLKICPEVRRLAASVEIRKLVTPLLGEDCFAVRAMFFDKVPDANWKLGWHQDSFIAVRERVEAAGFIAWSQKAGIWQVQPPAEVMSKMLAIRVHLDDCDATNGPLRVLPGSHKYGWLDDELELWKSRVPEVSCHVAAGGVVAMRPLLLHASAAARVPRHRRVIHLEFACEDLPFGLEWNQRTGPARR